MKYNPLTGMSNILLAFLSKYSVQQEEVIGLDITPRTVRLMQVSKSGEKWTIEKLSYRHIDDSVKDIKSNAKRFSDEIQIAIKAGKFSTTNAALSLPVSNSIIKVLTIALMTEEEMEKAINFNSLWENLTQLPGTLEEYSIFYQVIKKDTATNMMDVLFVASKLADINIYVDIARNAGINPVVLDVRCFALRNAFETKKISKGTKKPLAILEIGEYENFLLILKQETPYVSDIFVGAKDKELIGKPQKSKDILSPILDRYIMQINQNLTAYSNRYKTEKIENLFIVSSSPNTDDIIEILNKKLKNITIIKFDPLSGVTIPANIKEKVDAEDNKSSFTAAIGLSTRKLDIFGYYKKVTGVKNINLLPNRETVKKARRTKLISGIFMVLSVLIILGISGYFGYGLYKKTNVNQDALVDYDIKKEKVKNLQIELIKLQNSQKKLVNQMKLSETATTNQIAASLALNVITQTTTSETGVIVYISEISYEGNNEYFIVGDALHDKDIILYASNLRKSNIVSNVILEKSSLIEGTDIKTFNIKLKIIEELMNAKTINKEIIEE